MLLVATPLISWMLSSTTWEGKLLNTIWSCDCYFKMQFLLLLQLSLKGGSFLGNIPDQPTTPGLVRAAATNSLLDQVPLVPDLDLS